MKRALIGGLAGVVGLAGSAFGADLRTAKAPVAAMAPAWSWAGSYIGVHGGWGFGGTDHTFLAGSGFAPAGGGAFDQDSDGGIGGFQTGRNWQVGNWVFGLEGSTAWTGISGKDTGVFGGLGAATYETKIETLSTFTPRLGFTGGNWLFYGKAGLAYATVESTLTNGAQYFREKTDHIGWTAGLGLEYALTQNWILGIEYNYIDLGDERYAGTGTAFADFKADITFSTVLARLSYKFGAGGNPITAAIFGPPNPAGIWNGLYAGIHGGYGWGTDDRSVYTAPVALTVADNDVSGGVFGGHVGYMTQLGNWVVGTEVALAWSGVSETSATPLAGVTAKTELNWLASVTGRLGYSWGPWLVYGKGGAAMGEVDSSFTTAALTFKESNAHIGWTAGVGVEYALAPNWIVGVEYNYVNLGDQKYGGLASNGSQWFYEGDVTLSTVLARLSYKFGAPAPVVAKY